MKLARNFATSLTVASFLFAAGLFTAGCAANTDDVADESATTGEAEADVTAADSANFGYFQFVRRDTRRCASPTCGGIFVKRVNEAKTTCADGSRQAACYVASVEFGGMGLSAREEAEFRAAFESGRALVKAKTYKVSRGSSVGELKANEGWLGQTGVAVGDASFYRVADNGLRCVRAPCPSLTAYGLNGAANYQVVDVLFEGVAGANERSLDRARNALATTEGVIVGGAVALPKCRPEVLDCGPKVVPTEIYSRVVPTDGKACGGRSAARATCADGQACFWTTDGICGRADAQGTCGFVPQICTRQFAPVCGCDAQTYGNSCEAHAAGTSVASNGACP